VLCGACLRSGWALLEEHTWEPSASEIERRHFDPFLVLEPATEAASLPTACRALPPD
jgi:hypothetical protein